MYRNRNDLVPIHDSENPYRDCCYGWSVIGGMSIIALSIVGIGVGLLFTYYPHLSSTTTTTATTTHHQTTTTTTTTSAPPNDTLFTNTILEQDKFLLSNNKVYYAVIQGDGNFVVYASRIFDWKYAIWNSRTGSRPLSAGPFYVAMQGDGNVVIYGAHSGPIWNSHTYHKGTPPYRLVMQDDGNLVLYDNYGRAKWSSK